VLVVEILEGHVMVRFEDLFLGPPWKKCGFSSFFPHNPHIFIGWVLLVPKPWEKMKPSTENRQLSCFKMLMWMLLLLH
jgi:hypothetical protein